MGLLRRPTPGEIVEAWKMDEGLSAVGGCGVDAPPIGIQGMPVTRGQPGRW
jgi:hypothetical protein